MLHTFIMIFISNTLNLEGKPVLDSSVSSSLELCCKIVENSLTYRWEKLVTPQNILNPGKSPLIELYGTPFYHKTIKRMLCHGNNKSEANSSCSSGTCKQKYVKQKILTQEIDINNNTSEIVLKEIWVPSGCKFEQDDVTQVQGTENKSIQNCWSFIANIRVTLKSSNRIDDMPYDVSYSSAILKSNNLCLIFFSTFWFLYVML